MRASPSRPPVFTKSADGAPAFPLAEVRDLLGLVRALYAAAKRGGAPPVELARVQRVGSLLRRSLTAARQARSPEQHLSAWQLAEQGAAQVGDLVDALTPAEPIVHAARDRVGGGEARGLPSLRAKPPPR